MNNYFYIQEAEQFTFYRIPKALFTNEKYKKMSIDSKVLYGLLLDRVGLSIRNNWVDESQRVYIIFTREEAQDYLGVGTQKIVKLFKELNTYGLIEEVRQGLNKPNIIYVKKFIQSIDNTKSFENHNSETFKIKTQKLLKSKTNDTDFNNTDFNDISQSQNRQTDIEIEKEQILEQAQVHLYKGDHRQLLETTIDTLLRLQEIKVNNTLLNKKQIREQLSKLNINMCDFTFTKFRQAQQEKEIKNKAKYFQVLLMSCIYEYSANSIYE
ncbi:TPA: replication initiator protein A [Bacillus anthracis]|nr:replication initiator protein A [Bacillus anthracis]